MERQSGNVPPLQGIIDPISDACFGKLPDSRSETPAYAPLLRAKAPTKTALEHLMKTPTIIASAQWFFTRCASGTNVRK